MRAALSHATSSFEFDQSCLRPLAGYSTRSRPSSLLRDAGSIEVRAGLASPHLLRNQQLLVLLPIDLRSGKKTRSRHQAAGRNVPRSRSPGRSTLRNLQVSAIISGHSETRQPLHSLRPDSHCVPLIIQCYGQHKAVRTTYLRTTFSIMSCRRKTHPSFDRCLLN